ncbi:MAG: MopE-related protein [Polyangiaceae bacterium]
MNEPKRLIVSEDNELGVALAAARRQLPDASRLEQLAQRLAEQGVAFPAGMTGPVAPAQPEPSGFRLGLKLKVGIGIALLGGLGGAGAWSYSRSGEHSASVSSAKPEAARVVSLETAHNRPLSTSSLAAAPQQRRAEARAALAAAARAEPTGGSSEPSEAPEAAVVSAAAAPARSATRAASTRSNGSSPTVVAAAPNNTVYVAPSGEELPVTELELIKRARNAVSAESRAGLRADRALARTISQGRARSRTRFHRDHSAISARAGAAGPLPSHVLSHALSALSLPAPNRAYARRRMSRLRAPLGALALLLCACENPDQVFLGSLITGSGGSPSGHGGAPGSTACNGVGQAGTYVFSAGTASCADQQLFTAAVSEPPATEAEREPQLIYPNHETRLPTNVTRVRCEWNAGEENTLFELSLKGDSSSVLVYTSESSWQPSDAEWARVARDNLGGSISVRVRGLKRAAPERAFESPPITLYSVAPLLDAPIYYWSTTAHGLMRSRLMDSTPERLGLPGPPADAGACVGCHSLSRDGERVALDFDGGKLRVAMVADLTATLVPTSNAATPMGAGKAMDKVGPDAPALWSTFSPDGAHLVQALNGALTLLDDNGAPMPGPAGMIALPPKLVATHPDWSPLGDSLFATLAEKGNGRAVERGQIASFAFDGTQFGAAQILVPNMPPEDNNIFPAVSPDGRFVAYVTTKGKSDNAPASEVRLLRLADSKVFTLPRLNGRVNGVDGVKNIANSMPSWVPSIDPSQLWLAFSSVRAYGSVRPQNPKLDQIWLAAIDPDAEDPGFSAFWAPFQSLFQGNHRPSWGNPATPSVCSCHELCGDGIDNDCDGLSDEVDCIAGCAEREVCGDGIDNDCDCVVDDCALELCTDGIDNDFDGFVDAADPACMK